MIAQEDILKPIQFVAENSECVTINERAIDSFVKTFKLAKTDNWLQACPFQYKKLEKFEDELDRRFLQDAQAFCFWGYQKKWTIEYQSKKLDGWWALLASFQKALDKNTLILEGEHLAQMTLEQTKELFEGKPEIPLLQGRKTIFNAIGKTLVEKYNGRFHNFYAQTSRDALKLLSEIVQEFPVAYDDVSTYKGKTVYFYKKAQLLVDELVDEVVDPRLPPITGVEQLLGKADYKIPAILRKYGILVYDISLSDKVDNRVELPPDSEEEVEIRAGMLWACHLICERLKKRGIPITPMTLDGILWVRSQEKSDEDKPYHLTKTTDY